MMKTYQPEAFVSLALTHGRTLCEEGAFWMNWSLSGLTLRFRGRELRASLRALSEQLPGPAGAPPSPIDWPCLGVAEDGQLIRRLKVDQEEGEYLLYQGDEKEHEIRLVKLSENARGKLGILALFTDGELMACVEETKQGHIEFIGDSITCGFGNEAKDRDDPFETSEENAWIAYGALAGRELGMETDLISVSGISCGQPLKPMFPMDSMDELYPYQDRLFQRKLGVPEKPYDFAAHPKEIIILNLGTNDVNPVRFNPDFEQAALEEQHFGANYRTFLEQIRKLNGPDALIGCVLGPLDYYLYDVLKETVEAYIRETGDKKVFCYKFIGVNLMSEGFGAVGHPSAKTHQRMARELAGVIRREMNQRK